LALGLLIAVSLALGVAAWLGFLWSVRSGQYDDPEGPKYRMLEEDDDVGGPTEVAPRSGADEKRIDDPHRSD
jgi:cbb3-type cytochrome oxidase maturation protein